MPPDVLSARLCGLLLVTAALALAAAVGPAPPARIAPRAAPAAALPVVMPVILIHRLKGASP